MASKRSGPPRSRAIADGQTNGIVMMSMTGENEPRRLVWTPVSSGTYHYPTASPTGSTVAYAVCTAVFACEVHTADLRADFTLGATDALTSQKARILGIAWLPDGGSLVYGSGALVTSFLWRIPTQGGEPVRLELAGDHAAFPALSKAAGSLAYSNSPFRQRPRTSGDLDLTVSCRSFCPRRSTTAILSFHQTESGSFSSLAGWARDRSCGSQTPTARAQHH